MGGERRVVRSGGRVRRVGAAAAVVAALLVAASSHGVGATPSTVEPAPPAAASLAAGERPDTCVVAGTADGTFPAWNAVGRPGPPAAAPDGSVVFPARGHLWRLSGTVVRELAGGGATVARHAAGPMPAAHLRLDEVGGLDVAADGTVWANDGRTLFRLRGGTVTPVWTPPQVLSAGRPVDVELAMVRASAAGVHVLTSEPGLAGSRVRRVQRVREDGTAEVVAGGGYVPPSQVGADGTAATEVQIKTNSGFAVDDAGRIAVDGTTQRVLVTGADGRFRPTPALADGGGVESFDFTEDGTLVVSTGSGGAHQLDGTEWTRWGAPGRLFTMDAAADGSLVGLNNNRAIVRATRGALSARLAGVDPDRPRFTNAGRTAATALLGRIGALEAHGDDLLVAEEVPVVEPDHGGSAWTSRIVRIRPDGSVLAVAGDGGPGTEVVAPVGAATDSPIGRVVEIDVDDDGRVAFASPEFGIGRVELDGTLTQLLAPPWTGQLLRPTGFELLDDGSVLYGDRYGELFRIGPDGDRHRISGFRGSNNPPVVPIPSLRLQSIGDIETDRDGTVVVGADQAVWRLDLAAGVARRVESTYVGHRGVVGLIGPFRSVALDPVGNVWTAAYEDLNGAPRTHQSGLWRIGADDALTGLGRIHDEWDALAAGDPEDLGQVGHVAVDGAGRPVLGDAASGRIRRLGCTDPSPSGAHPVDPVRLLDTRDGIGRPGTERPGPGEVVEVQVAGRGGVPGGATAATLNVTATEPAFASHLTVWPCGSTPPRVSNLNFAAGATVPNQVNVALSGDGRVCLQSPAAAHLVVDLTAWHGAGGVGLRPLAPLRLLDTRDEGARVPPGREVRVDVAGRGGVPAAAAAASLNVTVTEPAAGGWLAAYPCGSERPRSSNLNFVAGQTVPNAVLSRLGEGGSVCLLSPVELHVVVDVVGSWDPGGEPLRFLTPERVVDTRSRWGRGAPTRITAGRVTRVLPVGAVGVPADAGAVVVNATAVGAAGPGFVTLFPCDGPAPTASSMNVGPVGPASPPAVANAAVAALAADGSTCVLASTGVDLLLDVGAYVER